MAAGGFDERPKDGSSPDTPGYRGQQTQAKSTPPSGRNWVEMARDAFQTSTSFVESELLDKWQRNEKLFNSEHASGSKYLSPQFRYRSTIFRPKTREASRKAEAQAAAAFFSTEDVVSVTATDDGNAVSRAAALIGREVLNHRLNSKGKNSIPWFLTLVGALQDSRKYGLCVSKKWWEYCRKKTGTEDVAEAVTLEDGSVGGAEYTRDIYETVYDRPRCDLIQVRNFRFDPGADWIDPVGTSPYVIAMTPMYVGDVKARIKRDDDKTGEPAWLPVSDEQLARARTPETSRMPDKGKDNRGDVRIKDHEIVWVHENHFRIDGEDWVWWTLGTFALLSDPVPLEDVYWHGERPFVVGRALVETHKTYPEGHVGMTHMMQREINDLVNSRVDAVNFAITPVVRYKKGAQVDIAAITNRYPGRPIGMRDPSSDALWDKAPPPPSSGYQEEDRLNVSMDAVNGTFSPTSVNSNRQLNETVGGMELLDSSAGTIGEYDLRVFAETWAEPVLTQLLKLEQRYETDETVLMLAAEAADAWEMLQLDEDNQNADLVAELLKEDLAVKVNVGIGATDPQRQVQKFMFAIQSVFGIGSQLLQAFQTPAVLQSPGFKAISEEIFGKVGYRDGARFLDFTPPQGMDGPANGQGDPAAAQAQAMQAQQQAEQQGKVIDIQGKLALQDKQTQGRIAEKQVDHFLQMQRDAAQAQRDVTMNRLMGGQVVNVV